MVWSSADRNAERSRGANDLGPPVTSPEERRSVIRLRTASVMPIDCSVNGLPFGAITSAPALTQRLASGISEVMTISPWPARSAIQSSAASIPEPAAIRSISGSCGTRMKLAGDHADRQAVAGGDAVDFVFDRAGVGVDIDAGGVQDWRHRLGIWPGSADRASRCAWYSIGRRIARKTAPEQRLPRHFLRVPLSPEK